MSTDNTNREQLIKIAKLVITGQLCSVISHDLRNHLLPLVGNAQLVQLIDEPEQLKNICKSIEQKGTDLHQFMASVLSFASEIEDLPEWTFPKQILQEVLRLLRKTLASHKITIENNLSSSLPGVYISPVDLRLIFVALLSNAIEASKPKATTANTSPKIIIEANLEKTSSKERYNKLHIKFIDFGMGIKEEIKEHIFTPFFTGWGNNKHVGVGLSAAQVTAEKYNGRIILQSENKEATIFTLTLPVWKEK